MAIDLLIKFTLKKKYLQSKIFFLFYLIIFSFFPSSLLVAQEAGLPPGYYIVTEDGESRFIQRFVWHGGEYAIRYQVNVEIYLNGRYVQHFREETTRLFIEVSLPPGRYRFQVIPYDFFERQGTPSQWMYVEILYALQPEPEEVLPEIVTGEDGEELGFIFTVKGINIDPNAEFILVLPDKTQKNLDIVDVDEKGNKKIFINSSDISLGGYDVIVRNPGGLEARVGGEVLNQIKEESVQITESTEQVTEKKEQLTDSSEQIVESDEQITEEREQIKDLIEPLTEYEWQLTKEIETETKKLRFKPLKKTLVKIGAYWVPLFYIYGNNFDRTISLTGVALNVGLVFNVKDYYIGFELYGSLTNDITYIKGLNTGLNFLVEKWFANERAAIGFRAGASFQPILIPEIIFSINAGISLSWRVVDFLLLELRLNYSNTLGETYSGNFNPWLGFCFQF